MPIEIESAEDPRVADYLGLRAQGDAADTLDHFIAESELVITRLVTSKFTPHRSCSRPRATSG